MQPEPSPRSPEWTPEIDVDAALARRLLETQFPALFPATLEPFGVGWDNVAYLVRSADGARVFRFPQRALGARCTGYELTWLPTIADALPLPVSAPTHIGEPRDGYPYRFGGYPLLPGETACRCDLDAATRAACAPALARFLAALHTLPVDDATRAEAPDDWIRRTDLGHRGEQTTRRLDALRDAPADWTAGLDLAAARAEVIRLSTTPPTGAPPSGSTATSTPDTS